MNTEAQPPDWVREIVKIISSDIRKHFTIDEIAAKVGTNSYALKNTFKQVYGMGVYTYLMNIRLDKARELLAETDQSIKAIARQVGYKSSSNFVSAFRKKTGISPLAWRNLEKAKGTKR